MKRSERIALVYIWTRDANMEVSEETIEHVVGTLHKIEMNSPDLDYSDSARAGMAVAAVDRSAKHDLVNRIDRFLRWIFRARTTHRHDWERITRPMPVHVGGEFSNEAHMYAGAKCREPECGIADLRRYNGSASWYESEELSRDRAWEKVREAAAE